MNRTLRAFLIAPLWAPALTGLQMLLFGLPRSMGPLDPTEWLLLSLVLSLLLGCAGVWTLGVLIHRLLATRRITALWRHIAIWFAAGLAVRMLLLVATWAPTGGLAFGLSELQGAMQTRPLFLLSGGLAGALMGGTIWLIAGIGRPGEPGPSSAK